jgi:lipid II:glycine glycyltransferase (peptidoglycan interpeptide bridge formation enzyme)
MKIKPLEFYLRLFHEYSLIDKIKVFLAKKKEEVLAGLILLRNRFICHYWFSAIKKNYENLGQGDLLQWEAIKWSKAMGSRYYDLCVVEPERLPDIAHFKLGFSKNLVPFYLITKKSLLYRACSKFNLKIF